MQKNVKDLEENCLYRCKLHHGALFDALLVDHDNTVVYVFQSSNLRGNKHSLDYKTVFKVMDKLNMLETVYRMVYVYCSDWSTTKEIGCNPTNGSNPPLSEDSVDKVKGKFSILIARVCYYPLLNEAELLSK